MSAIMLYLLCGLIIAMYCSYLCGKSSIPWHAFLVTIIIWPYTIWLVVRQ